MNSTSESLNAISGKLAETHYEVICGNIGSVHTGHSFFTAKCIYDEYVLKSKNGEGRAANESVYLFRDGEPIHEHHGIEAE